MARRNMRKPRGVAGRNPAQAEAVEHLQELVGRLIARRILRESTLNRGPQYTAANTPAGTNRTN